MKSYLELKRHINKYVIIYMLLMLLGFVIFIPGGILLDKNETDIFGIIFIILGVLIVFVSILCMGIVVQKNNKKLLELKVAEIKCKLSRVEGKQSFISINDERVDFFKDYLLVNGKMHSYDALTFKGLITFHKKVDFPALGIFLNDFDVIQIPFDGDLLEIIKDNEIIVINKEDLDYYINNLGENRIVNSFRQSSGYQKGFEMHYAKTEEEIINEKKQTKKGIIILLSMFVGVVLLNLFVSFISNTKDGIQFAKNVGIREILFILLALGMILIIFVKTMAIKLYMKLISLLYVILYLLGIFLFSGKVIVFIDIIYFLVFGVFFVTSLINDEKKKDKKEKTAFRFLILFSFVFLSLVSILNNMEFLNGKIWLVPIYAMIIITLIVGVLMVLYLKKEASKRMTKNQKVTMFVGSIFSSLVFGYLVSMILIMNLNYVFDNSNGILYECEIIEIKSGGDDSSDKAIVFIENKEYSIPISNEEYFEFKPGDLLEVYYYEGAFNIPYFIHYNE